LKRAIGALKALPNLTPGLDVRIEIGHTLGTEEFRETHLCGRDQLGTPRSQLWRQSV
jgi:hypothetical protein